jgi:hypothetical protein
MMDTLGDTPDDIADDIPDDTPDDTLGNIPDDTLGNAILQTILQTILTPRAKEVSLALPGSTQTPGPTQHFFTLVLQTQFSHHGRIWYSYRS